jgi:uncharacterized protein (TIGR00106 family)
MIAEFAVFPLDGDHMSEDVAKVIKTLEATGLDYRLGPMGTCVEGTWEQVLVAIQRCHQAVAAGHGRVITTIVIDDRKDQLHSLSEMIIRVEQQLGQQVKH